MKNIFQQIIDICTINIDDEGLLAEIAIKAKNRVIRYEWVEKYGIKLADYCLLAENDYFRLDDYQTISYFKNGYKSKEQNRGRYISWEENKKQPVEEWVYSISFPTGAYIFGENYNGQQQIFQDFFNEILTYTPDFKDLHNHNLYWKPENAKEIMLRFKVILDKYKKKNKQELKAREIIRLEAELQKLKA